MSLNSEVDDDDVLSLDRERYVYDYDLNTKTEHERERVIQGRKEVLAKRPTDRQYCFLTRDLELPEPLKPAYTSGEDILSDLATNIQLADNAGAVGGMSYHQDPKQVFPYAAITASLDLLSNHRGEGMERAQGGVLAFGYLGFGFQYEERDVAVFRTDITHGVTCVTRSQGGTTGMKRKKNALPCARGTMLLISQRPTSDTTPLTKFE